MTEVEEETLHDLINDYICNDADAMSNLVKDYSLLQSKYIISDMREKLLQELLNTETFDSRDIAAAAYLMGNKNFSGLCDGNDDDEDDWTDDMVQEYADNIRNYLYTYKKEAINIDPSIDPNEEHRGPMAQDLEKVVPDCVKETPEGVKTVDGNRLALVNAGVIGDLARRLIELEDKVNGR